MPGPGRAVFVGERNPTGQAPLVPWPVGSAGDRLRKHLQMLIEDYMSCFDRVNLCEAKWSIKVARKNKPTADRLILLGAKVCNAMGCRYLPFSVFMIPEGRALVLPHPSGRCRTWNNPRTASLTRRAVESFVPEAGSMQTFLPDPDFAISASLLDQQRLLKQRAEVLYILANPSSGHPAAKMWVGSTNALVDYGVAICEEIVKRGFADSSRETILAYKTADAVPPRWLGNAEFHASHRSNLLRKDPCWYGGFGWTESDDLEYVWPKGKLPPIGRFDL